MIDMEQRAMRGQYLYEPDPPPAGPGGPLKRLLSSALLVAGLGILLFVIAPYVVRDAPPPQAPPTPTPTPTAALPSSTPTLVFASTQTVAVTGTPSGTAAPTRTPYPGFSASSLDQMDLKLAALHSWTNADWLLLHSSGQLNSFVADPALLANVQALSPVGVKMQAFVQVGGLCTQPFCQVSWVGIVFPSPEEAYRALMLFNAIFDTSAPELNLAYSYAGAAPSAGSIAGSVPTPDKTEKGTALSFCYVWKNMFIRISTLSQFYPSTVDIDESYALVDKIFASWGQPTIP